MCSAARRREGAKREQERREERRTVHWRAQVVGRGIMVGNCLIANLLISCIIARNGSILGLWAWICHKRLKFNMSRFRRQQTFCEIITDLVRKARPELCPIQTTCPQRYLATCVWSRPVPPEVDQCSRVSCIWHHWLWPWWYQESRLPVWSSILSRSSLRASIASSHSKRLSSFQELDRNNPKSKTHPV